MIITAFILPILPFFYKWIKLLKTNQLITLNMLYFPHSFIILSNLEDIESSYTAYYGS